MDAKANIALIFTKGFLTKYAIESGDINFNTLGDGVIKRDETVGLADGTLDIGAIGTIGWIALHNTASVNFPPAVDPVITQGGTPGTNNDTYILVFHYADGSLSVSSEVTTALAAATLNGTNYNILTWTNPTGVTSVDLYRTLADGTPSTLGKIATGVTSPHNDQGAAGDGAATPAGIPSNFPIIVGEDGSSYPDQVWAGETIAVRWNGAAIHRKAITTPTKWEYLLLEA